jgi:hypothetical protein
VKAVEANPEVFANQSATVAAIRKKNCGPCSAHCRKAGKPFVAISGIYFHLEADELLTQASRK